MCPSLTSRPAVSPSRPTTRSGRASSAAWPYGWAILAPVAEHIDHVGSTAVPGLAAKDCIDIQIRVPRLNEAMIVLSFAELGFRLRPEPWNHIELTAGRQWPKLVFAPPVGERAANVHVRATSSATARRNLLFRDGSETGSWIASRPTRYERDTARRGR